MSTNAAERMHPAMVGTIQWTELRLVSLGLFLIGYLESDGHGSLEFSGPCKPEHGCGKANATDHG